MSEDKGNLPELPESWVWTTLGEITEPSNEKVNPSKIQEMPYVGLKHIAKNTGRLLDHGFSSGVRSTKTKFYRGDLLYGKLRPYLNKVYVADFDGVCSTDILVFPKSPSISNKYLLYRFLCSDFVEYANRNVSGVQHPRVNFKTLSRFPTPLPPLPEQHRIVARIEEFFTKLDAGVGALKKIKAQLKRYRQAVLKYAFEGKLTEGWREAHRGELELASALLERIKEERKKSAKGKYKELPPLDASGLAELPEGWVWTRLGEVCNTTSGGTPLRSKREYYGGSIPWLKSGELKDNIIHQSEESITETGLSNSSAKVFPKGTLLIALYGATVWKLGKLGIDAATNQAICGIFNIYGALEENYLFSYLISYRGNLLSNRFGGAQSNISQEIVRNIMIPLPPLAEQLKIVEEIEHQLSVADETEKVVDQNLKRSKRLRQSILKKAFEGKLVPQDPNDEPAEKLLERIKAEKTKRGAARKKERKTKRKRTRKKRGR